MIELASDIGAVARKLEPVVQIIERVSAAFGIAKRDEESQAKLPPPAKPKQIEAPRKVGKALPLAHNNRPYDISLDEEIPF